MELMELMDERQQQDYKKIQNYKKHLNKLLQLRDFF